MFSCLEKSIDGVFPIVFHLSQKRHNPTSSRKARIVWAPRKRSFPPPQNPRRKFLCAESSHKGLTSATLRLRYTFTHDKLSAYLARVRPGIRRALPRPRARVVSLGALACERLLLRQPAKPLLARHRALLGKPVPPNEGGSPAPNGSTASLEESIAAKKALLLEGGIALWDAIEECDIKGSSDASIKNVVPAHIERITECAHIEAVICNGATAGRLYKRYLQWKVGLVAHVLPSTSPANAAWKTERLIERWGNELRAIANELAGSRPAAGNGGGRRRHRGAAPQPRKGKRNRAHPQRRLRFLWHHTNRRTCRLELRGAQVDAGKQARQHQARAFDARAAARGGTWRIPSAVEGRRAPLISPGQARKSACS